MGRVARWLCPSELDRLRLLDSSERIRRARTVGLAAIGIAVVAMAPWLGWWKLAILVLAGVQLLTLDWRVRHAERPELAVAFSLLYTETAIALGVIVTGGSSSPLLPWMASLTRSKACG